MGELQPDSANVKRRLMTFLVLLTLLLVGMAAFAAVHGDRRNAIGAGLGAVVVLVATWWLGRRFLPTARIARTPSLTRSMRIAILGVLALVGLGIVMVTRASVTSIEGILQLFAFVLIPLLAIGNELWRSSRN